MPHVYDVLKSGDEGPTRWWVVRQPDATPVVVAADKGGVCQRCHDNVAVSSESDVYLLVGELHHPECILTTMAGL